MADEEGKRGEVPAVQPTQTRLSNPYDAGRRAHRPLPPATPMRRKAALAAIVAAAAATGLAIAIPFMQFSSAMCWSGWGEWETTMNEFDGEVALPRGGVSRILTGWSSISDISIFINVTHGSNSSHSSNVDAYLMTFDQYVSAYENPSMFSAIACWENVSELSVTCDVSDYPQTLCIVVDNLDSPLREGDAVPDGSVVLDLKVVATWINWL